ncbi:MAG: LPS export ABC transporter periplasmic protein LptC [Candidatus Latescibacterota bacterium]|nr:MAG: LPS export ABC transporter periplasmic protein LptC [Candidatus Latescibacterota bacterium]
MRWFVLATICLLACSREPQDVPSGEGGPVQESWEAEIRITEEGRPKCTILAEHLLRYENPDRSELEGVRATFYDRKGQASIKLTAERGVVYEDRVEVEGNVVLTYGDSLKVETQRARWDRKGGRITSEGPVRIETPEGEEVGEGFVCEAHSGRWWMRSVRGQVLAP